MPPARRPGQGPGERHEEATGCRHGPENGGVGHDERRADRLEPCFGRSAMSDNRHPASPEGARPLGLATAAFLVSCSSRGACSGRGPDSAGRDRPVRAPAGRRHRRPRAHGIADEDPPRGPHGPARRAAGLHRPARVHAAAARRARRRPRVVRGARRVRLLPRASRAPPSPSASPSSTRWFPTRAPGLALGLYGVGMGGTVLAGLTVPRIADAWGMTAGASSAHLSRSQLPFWSQLSDTDSPLSAMAMRQRCAAQTCRGRPPRSPRRGRPAPCRRPRRRRPSARPGAAAAFAGGGLLPGGPDGRRQLVL